MAMDSVPPVQSYIFKEAVKGVMKQTKGLYPAPLTIIEVLKKDTDEAEAQGFGKLLMTPESIGLRHLFHCITHLKKMTVTIRQTSMLILSITWVFWVLV